MVCIWLVYEHILFFSPLWMIAMIQNVIWSTRWSFVLIATIVSMVIGVVWYGKILFGPLYMRYMHITKDKNPGMIWPMIYEFIARVLFFIWFRWILVTWGKVDFMGALPVAILVWLVFVFSTQLSLVARGSWNKKVIWIVAWKMLVDVIWATRLFSYMLR